MALFVPGPLTSNGGLGKDNENPKPKVPSPQCISATKNTTVAQKWKHAS